MMDSLFTILGNKNYEEPAEIKHIKQFALTKFKARVAVQVRDKDIIISVNNASLANSLRLCGPEIKRKYKINKRLIFRIDG